MKMKKTILNLLFATIFLLPTYASADEDSFLKALWEQNVSTMLSNAGLLVVFGEHDFTELCALSDTHGANVQMIVSSLISDDNSENKMLRCN